MFARSIALVCPVENKLPSAAPLLHQVRHFSPLMISFRPNELLFRTGGEGGVTSKVKSRHSCFCVFPSLVSRSGTSGDLRFLIIASSNSRSFSKRENGLNERWSLRSPAGLVANANEGNRTGAKKLCRRVFARSRNLSRH